MSEPKAPPDQVSTRHATSLGVVGRYELLELIGKGGFGSVYRAEVRGPMGFAEEVAVKIVHPKLAQQDPDVLFTLADEARILSHLRHPNVVGLRSFERIEQAGDVHHLLVLEFVRGVTLDHLINLLEHMGRPMPFSAILCLWHDALAGLHHAHRAVDAEGMPLALVHRDLKPPNLMVDRGGTIRILDFGIAWARERLVRTLAGNTKGSPPWMSPEQVRSDPVTPSSDLWVLATMVYRLLSGQWWVRPPRSWNDITEVLHSLLSTEWPDRKDALHQELVKGGRLPLRRGDRKAIEKLLERQLEQDPADRSLTAPDVMSALTSMSGWDPEDGRATLSRMARGILKTGHVTGPVTAAETRTMGPEDQATTPGGTIPTKPS